MRSRFISSIYFMLDAFILSLLLVFVEPPTAWSWILTALFVSGSVYLLTVKYAYSLIIGVGISFVAILLLWVLGVPAWLALLLGILAIYMLHNRYSAFYDGFSDDHHFLVKFIVVFSACWVLLLLNPEAQSTQTLFTMVPVAILFYTISRVIDQYSVSKSEGMRLTQAVGAFGFLVSIASVAAIITFFIAEEVRRGLGWVVGGVIRLLFWPLALLMEQVTLFLSGLSTEEDMQETIDQLGPDEETTQNTQVISESGATDYPVEILIGLFLVSCVIVLVLWLRKVKPEIKVPIKETTNKTKRYPNQTIQTAVPFVLESSDAEMNLHQIREAFRELEKTAKEQNLGREDYETVREWVSRMSWNTSDSFYHTYDRVRYGDEQLPELHAKQFIADIQKIKKDYFKENV
ncbi:hypothetical protein Plano_2055 [Planococcus sp. PAMC 21323]|uniref:DUF4129 domain-containing protein n=1 Tax=Planococcus sp. PAMC 21323 TaxID=1526927 RepID=UPI00056F54F3|nr:DUF4129 domain-containing protein [Planococcus sp. PAMC 21323]AIY06020.1 hypothetical protein Plano_2055 [Planococcus sp. PAMC 21323]